MHGRAKHLPKGIVNGKGVVAKPRSSLMHPPDFCWALVRSKYSAMMLLNFSLNAKCLGQLVKVGKWQCDESMLAYFGDVDLLDLIEYVRYGLKSCELAGASICFLAGAIDLSARHLFQPIRSPTQPF